MKANGDVYIVEAKASNSDMKSDDKRGKLWKLVNSQRLDFVYYIIADRVDTDDLPPIFGILDENGRIVRKARRRQRVQTLGARLADFERFARVCSWRAYGHVIRQEQEQMEFSMVPDRSA